MLTQQIHKIIKAKSNIDICNFLGRNIPYKINSKFPIDVDRIIEIASFKYYVTPLGQDKVYMTNNMVSVQNDILTIGLNRYSILPITGKWFYIHCNEPCIGYLIFVIDNEIDKFFIFYNDVPICHTWFSVYKKNNPEEYGWCYKRENYYVVLWNNRRVIYNKTQAKLELVSERQYGKLVYPTNPYQLTLQEQWILYR